MHRLTVLLLTAIAMAVSLLDANAGGPLVDVQSVDPTITVELRYAGRNNLVGYPLYPHGTCALARPEVASGLATAQAFLRRYQFALCPRQPAAARLCLGPYRLCGRAVETAARLCDPGSGADPAGGARGRPAAARNHLR